MQSIHAREEYKNSFACAARIFRDEGILTFWSGALPRLVRLTVSTQSDGVYIESCLVVLTKD